MADLVAHINQANYNRKFAVDLNATQKHRDWVITVAFYAALHFVEAGLIDKNRISTEDRKGDEQSLHQKRLDEILDTFGRDCYRYYKKLFNESKRSRYLDNNHPNLNTPPAAGYYTQSDVDDFIEKTLEKLWNKINNECPSVR